MKSVFLLMSCVLVMVNSLCRHGRCGYPHSPSSRSREVGSWYGANTRCYTRVHRRITHYMYIINKLMSYTRARSHCEDEGGTLVKIDGSQDDIKMRRLIRRCGREGKYGDGDYWIGLNKLDDPGDRVRGYHWDLDLTKPHTTFWWRRANKYHDCVAMVQEGNYEWSARNCGRKLKFICEYPERLTEY